MRSLRTLTNERYTSFQVCCCCDVTWLWVSSFTCSGLSAVYHLLLLQVTPLSVGCRTWRHPHVLLCGHSGHYASEMYLLHHLSLHRTQRNGVWARGSSGAWRLSVCLLPASWTWLFGVNVLGHFSSLAGDIESRAPPFFWEGGHWIVELEFLPWSNVLVMLFHISSMCYKPCASSY